MAHQHLQAAWAKILVLWAKLKVSMASLACVLNTTIGGPTASCACHVCTRCDTHQWYMAGELFVQPLSLIPHLPGGPASLCLAIIVCCNRRQHVVPAENSQPPAHQRWPLCQKGVRDLSTVLQDSEAVLQEAHKDIVAAQAGGGLLCVA